jgi:benzylsuccinate CoA-transferase BbsE subunit
MSTTAAPATAGMTVPGDSALAGVRVLDLSQRFSHYCGKLFADMGADVILVEPPHRGSALRSEAPFLVDHADPEYGIPFFYYSTGKRGITLDLDLPPGQELLRKLAATADLVLEDHPPGALDERGIGYSALAELRPQLVLTSITPFGQSGPYAHYAADDLTLLALGGFLNMTGYPDMAPTQAFGNQAYAMGNMFGAVGSLLALLGAQTSGAGQQVDVSIQECVTMALENAAQFYELEGRVRTRFAGAQRQAGTGIFACVDGHVYLFAGGMAAIRFWKNLVKWMQDEQVPNAGILNSPQWADMKYLDSVAGKQTFDEMFAGFARGRSKEALYRQGQARRVPICPVSTPADVAASRQLDYRGFFTSVPHRASGQAVRMPGAPFQMSATPWRIARPAPQLGEHTGAVLGELGIGAEELQKLKRAGVV